MKYISLGLINKNIISIIIGIIFFFFNRLLPSYKDTILFRHQIIQNVYSAFSKLLAIIPYIIFKFRTKKNNRKT